MGKYVVVKYFTDLQDNNRPYRVGDTFPHSNTTVTQERLDELAGSENRQKTPLIKLIEDNNEKSVDNSDGEPERQSNSRRRKRANK